MHLAGNVEIRGNRIENCVEVDCGQGETKPSFIMTALVYQYNNKRSLIQAPCCLKNAIVGKCLMGRDVSAGYP